MMSYIHISLYISLYRVIQKDEFNHMVDWSFCLYRDSLFAQIGDSNDECSNEDETHAAQQSPNQF